MVTLVSIPMSSVDKVPNHESAVTENLTLFRTSTRHSFQARGSAKHLKRQERAKNQGDYGVILSVSHSDQNHLCGVVG